LGPILGLLLVPALTLGHVVQIMTKESEPCHCTYVEKAISCYYINTLDKANCASQFLRNISSRFPDSDCKVHLDHSNLTLLPDDFYVPCRPTGVRFYYCSMPEIPYRLLNPIGSWLNRIYIYKSSIESGTIPEGGFRNCTQLQWIYIRSNTIRSISSRAFEGLINLKLLFLDGNELQSFGGFEGIENLEHLELSENKITTLDRNAFQNLTKLNEVHLDYNNLVTLEEGTFDVLKCNGDMHVNLGGNPFHCNCSLKWLQDWLKVHTRMVYYENLVCVGPMYGPLKTLPFCNTTTSPKPIPVPVLPTNPTAVNPPTTEFLPPKPTLEFDYRMRRIRHRIGVAPLTSTSGTPRTMWTNNIPMKMALILGFSIFVAF